MNDTSSHEKRQPLHTRQVSCTGYLREDGLIDIEGRLLDTKTHDYQSLERMIRAGQPCHLMHLLMTVGLDFVIREVKAVTEAAPMSRCGRITPAYESLVGVKVGPGFTRRVAQLLGGTRGCTHLTELLGPMATTLYQTAYGLRRQAELERASRDPAFEPARPFVIGACHTYHPEGEAAQRLDQRWQEENRIASATREE
ncbi:DUF2889 domain-containing protein [Pseudomonas sp. BN102]|uniref:DUF2889 domain-containing protein n=1 Tax=Pseudomonas sp. BN102 TaxID=2567886 RepID=UPI002456D590|nr:DUF2889 domain-containing protein [Pseudomonas sp. BN102]MDH4610460.1 DUF2889 domain-containing protein [Pseudomonas sp. BN102]